jgi:hypothetical protein
MTVPQAIACGRLPYERRSTLNPIEPPWYGSVCPVVWEGWHREVSPYPDYGWLATSETKNSGSTLASVKNTSLNEA